MSLNLLQSMEAMTLPHLLEERSLALSRISGQKARIQKIDEIIVERLAEQAKNAMSAKTHGDVTLETPAGKFKASIDKTVKWDSTKLQNLAATLPWEKVIGIFKIDFSVPEAKYNALKDIEPMLAEKVEDARTVKYGDLKITPIE